MNLFEVASRKQFRFASQAGSLSVEDLWALPLQSKTNRANLDDVAKELHGELQQNADPVSFVSETNPNAEKKAELEMKFELVKYIISIRLSENKAANEAQDRAAKRQKILALIDQKKDQALTEQSVEDLQKLLSEM